jgi:hypothetical protein
VGRGSTVKLSFLLPRRSFRWGDALAGFAQSFVDEWVAWILVKDDELVVVRNFLAAVHREDSLNEDLWGIGIDSQYSRNTKEMSCAAVRLTAVSMVS